MKGPDEAATGRKAWEETHAGSRLRDADFSSLSGRPLEPLYTREDLAGLPDTDGLPGEYPFTRGVHASMYRGKLWTMRQFAGMGTAAQTNERYRFLLEKGQTGLSVAFDNPTLYGLDSITRSRPERSARPASRWTRWRTWSGCSTKSRSSGSRPP